jgi:gluconate 2-dehydrogenase alpha chain
MAKGDRQRKAHLGLKKRKGRKLQSRGFPTRIYQTTHVTGGTIMGIDPHTSVVSPHLQHWDAENLFVVGASNYPFNAGYNPTGPLGALALRLGDDLHSYVEQPRAL